MIGMFKILVMMMALFTTTTAAKAETEGKMTETAIFAGGCFWCMESDFEKLEGVVDVVSGYIGGSADEAHYKTVSKGGTGHREAVRVLYKPNVISYAELVDYFWKHIDPTDASGQFCDKGFQYTSAIYYQNDAEKKIAERTKAAIKLSKPVVTAIEAAGEFYDAEDYHQGYYERNPIRYKFYRSSCGRDKTIKKVWETSSH